LPNARGFRSRICWSRHDELAQHAAWRRIINSGARHFEARAHDFENMPAAERDVLDKAVIAAARDSFQYRYDIIRIPDDGADRAALPPALVQFSELLNHPDTIDTLRQITGEPAIAYADMQATRYRPGDFLTRHDDDVPEKHRLFAYVLGMTRGWKPEWGGLLHFTDRDDRLIDTIAPRFNALSLFAIRQPHSVSYVAPYASADRISVTGWLRSKRPG
jgi:SM-20-related protein